MRIMLIQPGFADIYGPYKHIYRKGFTNLPLSHCYLAAAALAAGHEATIVDAEAESLPASQVLRRIADFRPGLLGMTATSIDFLPALSLGRAVKERFPDIPLLLGGTHINIFREAVLRESGVFDFGCIGDGEDLLVRIRGRTEPSS